MTSLVRGAWALTMTGEGPGGAVREGTVAIGDGGEIVAVGPWEEMHARFPEADVAGDGNGIVLPGFVNAHTHLSEGLFPGMGETASLWEWFDRVVDPAGRVITREELRTGTRLRAAEMLLGGITTVNDMTCHRNLGSLASLGAADGLCEMGMRGVVSFGAEDEYTQAPGPEVFMAEHQALADRLAGEPLVGFRAGVGTILGISDELLALTVNGCAEHGWAVHTHLSEVREEVTAARGRFQGLTTIEHAAAVGLLDHETIAGHCIWCSSSEVSLLGARDVAVAHNPVANMILASGVCPVGALRSEGVTVALGTDGAASNDSQDMFGATKTAALMHKLVALRADAITAYDVLRMATVEGARALGLLQAIGTLEPGKRADVMLLDGNAPELATIHDPWQQVVYCATPRCVSDVWVDGTRRVRAGELTEADLGEIVTAGREQARELALRAGLVTESVYAGAEPGGPRPAGLAAPRAGSS